MPIALDPKKRSEYVLESERDTPNATVFLLRPLTFAQRAEVQDYAIVGNVLGTGIGLRQGAAQRLRLTHGLVGWRGFKDADGKDVKFEPDGASLDFLDEDTASELSVAIHALSTITKSDRD